MPLCLMLLVACSTAPKVIKAPILCPVAAGCQVINTPITTNGELAEGYLQARHQLQLCATENAALKACIDNHNKQQEAKP